MVVADRWAAGKDFKGEFQNGPGQGAHGHQAQGQGQPCGGAGHAALHKAREPREPRGEALGEAAGLQSRPEPVSADADGGLQRRALTHQQPGPHDPEQQTEHEHSHERCKRAELRLHELIGKRRSIEQRQDPEQAEQADQQPQAAPPRSLRSATQVRTLRGDRSTTSATTGGIWLRWRLHVGAPACLLSLSTYCPPAWALIPLYSG